jgi:hypothetical protein
MKFIYDDGGREAAGFKGSTGDCCARAISIALRLPYKEVYDAINVISKQEKYRGKHRSGNGVSSARDGVYIETMHKIMDYYGWIWVPCMKFGEGCKVHLKDGELPVEFPIICNLSKHYAAVVNGVLHDTYDCSRDGKRCVYGYWRPGKYKVLDKYGIQFIGTKFECQEWITSQPGLVSYRIELCN